MTRILLTPTLLLIMNCSAICQINPSDSTAQVIAYWNKNEKQNYTVTSDKIRIQDGDTISKEFVRYDVDITVQDSTESGYIINWFYHDYYIETDDELVKKLFSLVEDMNIQIRTDELGTFEEVINWEEIRKYILKGTSMMKNEMKDVPRIDKIISQMEEVYSSPKAIEASAINEILQFYYFHGVQYKHWKEYSYDNKLANLYGGQPFDAKVTFWLDEINDVDNNAVYRMQQVVDSDQLTNETFNYLSNLAETMQAPGPVREEFPDMHNETWMASRIHGSGWVLYSIQTKEVIAENVMQIEECIIELNSR